MACDIVANPDPHVAWLERRRDLRDQVRRAHEAQDDQIEEMLEIEEKMVDTPPRTRAGMLAVIEVAQWDLARIRRSGVLRAAV